MKVVAFWTAIISVILDSHGAVIPVYRVTGFLAAYAFPFGIGLFFTHSLAAMTAVI